MDKILLRKGTQLNGSCRLGKKPRHVIRAACGTRADKQVDIIVLMNISHDTYTGLGDFVFRWRGRGGGLVAGKGHNRDKLKSFVVVSRKACRVGKEHLYCLWKHLSRVMQKGRKMAGCAEDNVPSLLAGFFFVCGIKKG
ncbi:MAG: hypothetical protein LBP80_08355 [Treponema sp.]|nr:hypothetical protein [Treponema sp.]